MMIGGISFVWFKRENALFLESTKILQENNELKVFDMCYVLNWNDLYVCCFWIITFSFLKNKKHNIKTLFFCWNKTKILILQAVSNNATYKTFQLIGYRHHKHNTMSGLAGDLFLLHLFPKPFHLFLSLSHITTKTRQPYVVS